MRYLLMFLVAFSLIACEAKKEEKKEEAKTEETKKDEKPEEAKPEEAKPEEAKPEAKADGPTAIAQLGGLKATLPKDAQVQDGIMSGAMIMAPGCVVNLEEAGDMTPADLAKAKEDAEMYGPENIKEETLEDGWVLTYENKGGMGTNYWVQSRRKIGEKDYFCSTMGNSVEQQDCTIAICKSLAAP